MHHRELHVASTQQKSLAPIYTQAPYRMVFPSWLSGKESACSAGDAGDVGSIPRSGRSPGGGNGNPLQILAWKIPRTEEPGRLLSVGSPRIRFTTERLRTHTQRGTAGPSKSCSHSSSHVTSQGFGLVGWLISGRAAGKPVPLGSVICPVECFQLDLKIHACCLSSPKS